MTRFVGIPVHRRGNFHGFALVDADDLERVLPYKWRLNGKYASASVDGRNTLMHRHLCGLTYGDGKAVHHINENGLDNRRCNLQVCNSMAEANSQPHPKAWEAGRRAAIEWTRQRWAA